MEGVNMTKYMNTSGVWRQLYLGQGMLILFCFVLLAVCNQRNWKISINT